MTKKTVIVGISENLNDTMEKRAKQNSFLHSVMRLIETVLVFLSATLWIPVMILGAITSPLWCWVVAFHWARDYYKGDA